MAPSPIIRAEPMNGCDTLENLILASPMGNPLWTVEYFGLDSFVTHP